MSSTALQYLETVIEDRWREDIPGRENSVPMPLIRTEAPEDMTRVSQANVDLLVLSHGGESITPKGVGWTHREVENTVSVDLRTAASSYRLRGQRTASNQPEEYGGLRGEVQRIIDEIRKGDAEFDLIDGYEYRDLSDEVGHQFYRGVFEVRLTQYTQHIDP